MQSDIRCALCKHVHRWHNLVRVSGTNIFLHIIMVSPSCFTSNSAKVCFRRVQQLSAPKPLHSTVPLVTSPSRGMYMQESSTLQCHMKNDQSKITCQRIFLGAIASYSPQPTTSLQMQPFQPIWPLPRRASYGPCSRSSESQSQGSDPTRRDRL